MQCCARPPPESPPARPGADEQSGARRRRSKEPPCSSAPANRGPRTDSPRAEGDGPSQEDRHLSQFTDTKQMQSRLSVPRTQHAGQTTDRQRRSSRGQTVGFADEAAERRRWQSEPVNGRAAGRAAIRTESQLPPVLIEQIEDTKQALDTLIQQDLRRHRKKSAALVHAVERMMELLEDFEKLCTDEEKWGLLVHEVERCINRVRELITGFQEQTLAERFIQWRGNIVNFDSVTDQIGETIKLLHTSLHTVAGTRVDTVRYSEQPNTITNHVRAAAVRQIPTGARGFVGRSDVMRRLCEKVALCEDSCKICMLSGLRGAGKTAVATVGLLSSK